MACVPCLCQCAEGGCTSLANWADQARVVNICYCFCINWWCWRTKFNVYFPRANCRSGTRDGETLLQLALGRRGWTAGTHTAPCPALVIATTLQGLKVRTTTPHPHLCLYLVGKQQNTRKQTARLGIKRMEGLMCARALTNTISLLHDNHLHV